MRRCKYRATNCSPKEMPSRRATQSMKMPGTTARLTNNMKASALREAGAAFRLHSDRSTGHDTWAVVGCSKVTLRKWSWD